MRGLAWLLLLLGPLLSAPVAAGLWTHARLSGVQGADLYAGAALIAVAGVEGLLLWRRGVLREAAVLALSAFWAGWLWLAMTQVGYDWRALPLWRSLSSADWMVGIVLVLVYLAIYGLADTREERRPRLS